MLINSLSSRLWRVSLRDGRVKPLGIMGREDDPVLYLETITSSEVS